MGKRQGEQLFSDKVDPRIQRAYLHIHGGQPPDEIIDPTGGGCVDSSLWARKLEAREDDSYSDQLLADGNPSVLDEDGKLKW
jgi:hypothetical protein